MSGKCGGLHCEGCGKGGGLGILAVIVAVLLICAAIARPVEHAADVAVHILEIVAYCLAGLAGASALAAAAWLAVRWRRRSTTTAALPAPAPVTALPAPQQTATSAAEPPAIAPVHQELHIHLHGDVPAETVAAVRQALSDKAARP
jgi:hypothetical protein